MVKVPRFAFEKFPGADPVLTTHMKSVGEAMAIGRNFTEALGKAMRSMETKAAGFWTDPADVEGPTPQALLEELRAPRDGALYRAERALRAGASVAEVAAASGIDPWFLDQIELIRAVGSDIADSGIAHPRAVATGQAVRPCPNRQIAALRPELAARGRVCCRLRLRAGIRPVYKTVDTCAAEFAASTPYYYSTYDEKSRGPAPAGPCEGP